MGRRGQSQSGAWAISNGSSPVKCDATASHLTGEAAAAEAEAAARVAKAKAAEAAAAAAVASAAAAAA